MPGTHMPLCINPITAMKPIICFLLCLLSIQEIRAQQTGPATATIAITHVDIIPMSADGKMLKNATIVIRGNRILSINKSIPDSAQIIDGSGKWLIPGLIDMHVHIPVDGHFNTNYPTAAAAIFTNTQDMMTPFIANGVTTVFELNSRSGHFGQRNEILRGDVIGPRMALAAMIEGGEGQGRIANSPADGRQSVRMAKAEGYEFIKVYSKLNIETYKAVVDEAGKQGMKVVGHIPNDFGAAKEDALVPHFGMVAHAEEFFKQNEDLRDNDAKKYALLAKNNGTWLSPTLIVIKSTIGQARSLDSIRLLQSLKYVHPLLQSKWLTANTPNKGSTPARIDRLERMIQSNKRIVRAFHAAGVPILAGTDAGSSGVVWGFSLHDELRLLVEAGLSNEEALTSATRFPAAWLGLEDKIGTIEAGKFADLILLDANPLDDIRNSRKIAAVFVNGGWLSKQSIDSMLSDLAARNNAALQRYQWKNRAEY